LQEAKLNEPLRQAYASLGDTEAAKAVTPAPEVQTAPPVVSVAPPAPRPQPPPQKAASRPQPQKYALLSDAQIAGIKERLKLSSSQAHYWPDVEQALHALARKIQAARQVNPGANAGSLDPDSAEVQQLKSAAMPLLLQLREDQKDEVRRLARIIGLEKVAAAI
jgi:ABC-type transporter Mla MlaB component